MNIPHITLRSFLIPLQMLSYESSQASPSLPLHINSKHSRWSLARAHNSGFCQHCRHVEMLKFGIWQRTWPQILIVFIIAYFRVCCSEQYLERRYRYASWDRLAQCRDLTVTYHSPPAQWPCLQEHNQKENVRTHYQFQSNPRYVSSWIIFSLLPWGLWFCAAFLFFSRTEFITTMATGWNVLFVFSEIPGSMGGVW